MICDNFYFLITYKYRPSTSSSTAVYRTERSEQSDVQNIPTRSKSSTLDEPQLKQKEDGNLNIYCLCLYYVT